MARINLLPWREERRTQRRNEYFIALGLAALATVGIGVLLHIYFEGLISHQQARNQFIQQQTALLDKKIKEIEDLDKQKARLLARMRAIETLQTSRPIIVHLFDEIVNTLPEGVFLRELAQKDDLITIRGTARSNARVSSFMRKVEDSQWLMNPKLTVIENKDTEGQRVAEFTLTVQQRKPKSPDEEAEGGASG